MTILTPRAITRIHKLKGEEKVSLEELTEQVKLIADFTERIAISLENIEERYLATTKPPKKPKPSKQ